MIRARFVTGALAASFVASTAPAAADKPDVQTAVAALAAGGGPAAFRSTTLLGVLSGARTGDELAGLVRSDGAQAVTATIDVFDFVVADALRLMQARGFRIPVAPAAESIDGRALAGDLYRAGLRFGHTFAAQTMFDRLLTPAVRLRIDADVADHFGSSAGARLERSIGRVMRELQALYAL